MRHTMLVPLRLMVRSEPPPEPKSGDLYFNSGERVAYMFDGSRWSALTTSSSDEVMIDDRDPSSIEGTDGVELWVDTTDGGGALSGAFLPIVGGELSGTLVISPDSDQALGLVVGTGGIDTVQGGVRIRGDQVMQDDYAITLGYLKSYVAGGGGGGGTGDGSTVVGGGARVYSGVYGNGTDRTIVVEHRLKTENVVLSLWSTSTNEMGSADVQVLSMDAVELTFSTAPPSAGVRVVVMAGTVGEGSGGGVGVSDHGLLAGLSDPDHPISAIQGLQAALDGKSDAGHSHASSGLTQAQADTFYVNVTGDAMTGSLTLTGSGVKVSAPFVESTGGLKANGQVWEVADPTTTRSAANKGYVDSRIWVGTQDDYDLKVQQGGIDPTVLYCIRKG